MACDQKQITSKLKNRMWNCTVQCGGHSHMWLLKLNEIKILIP